SPFEAGKLATRKKIAAMAAKACKAPLVYVNLIGGQDDIVFDGASFVVDAKGKLVAQCAEFTECVYPVAWQSHAHRISRDPAQSLRDSQDRLWSAMALGLHDYVHKNGFKKVLTGLSGGIDSALTAALAVDVLGAKNVKGALLPSPYTSQDSTEDAL